MPSSIGGVRAHDSGAPAPTPEMVLVPGGQNYAEVRVPIEVEAFKAPVLRSSSWAVNTLGLRAKPALRVGLRIRHLFLRRS